MIPRTSRAGAEEIPRTSRAGAEEKPLATAHERLSGEL
jgi:hypothetical protein